MCVCVPDVEICWIFFASSFCATTSAHSFHSCRINVAVLEPFSRWASEHVDSVATGTVKFYWHSLMFTVKATVELPTDVAHFLYLDMGSILPMFTIRWGECGKISISFTSKKKSISMWKLSQTRLIWTHCIWLSKFPDILICSLKRLLSPSGDVFFRWLMECANA